MSEFNRAMREYIREHTVASEPRDGQSRCWLWTAARKKRRDGTLSYGTFKVGRKNVMAHRASYEAFTGPIPAGLGLLHSCDNTGCVNPAHLRPGTQSENGEDVRQRRRARCADITHCKNGHPFDEANTYTSTQRGKPRRHCRICRREAGRKFAGFTGDGRWPNPEGVRIQ